MICETCKVDLALPSQPKCAKCANLPMTALSTIVEKPAIIATLPRSSSLTPRHWQDRGEDWNVNVHVPENVARLCDEMVECAMYLAYMSNKIVEIGTSTEGTKALVKSMRQVAIDLQGEVEERRGRGKAPTLPGEGPGSFEEFRRKR